MQLNADLLRQRAKEIRDALAVLARYGHASLEDFLARPEILDAAKYRLVVAIEAAVAICTHLAARLADRTPESYADCFVELGRAGIIPADLADRLGQMARFRNLLVHLYWEVDNPRVWEILRQDLGNLEAYLDAVGRLVPGARRMGREISEAERAEIKRAIAGLLATREEMRFAVLHGSFLEPRAFRDLDVAVWVDPQKVPWASALDYEFGLSAEVERAVRLPADVKILNYAPLGFRYWVTGGEPLVLRDAEEWFDFRERTWRDYWDFAPLAKEALLDLLSPAP